MPFTKRPDLPPNPSVRIFFIGLNILASAANDTCQTFVHNSSPEHQLLIEVRRKRPGKPDVLMMRRPGPLTFLEDNPSNIHGLLIHTEGLPPGQKAVKAYDGTNASTEGTSLFDSFVLSEILDVPPGEVDPDGGLPSILIDNGVFYTANKVPVKAKFVKKRTGKEKPRNEVPTIIGANIYLNPQIPAQQVKLFFRQDEPEEKDVHLDLKPSPDFSYEIYVINEPLFEEDSPSAPQHDEFEEYFKILPDVPEDEQYKFVSDPVPDRGTTRNPCMSVLLP